jgi:hypothetical protein
MVLRAVRREQFAFFISKSSDTHDRGSTDTRRFTVYATGQSQRYFVAAARSRVRINPVVSSPMPHGMGAFIAAFGII